MPFHLDPSFIGPIGAPYKLTSKIRRVTASNSGPFTFKGTNSYIIGHGHVAIIDPGPDDPDHIAALLAATNSETITHIFVTHTHLDHSPAAAILAQKTGAPIYAEGPHRAARILQEGEVDMLDRSADKAFQPDITLHHGDRIEGDDWAIEAIATPGHTANHMAFALYGENQLFCGDHVMAWSTSIVAPPDGSMVDYMASLHLLLSRQEQHYFPGHGRDIANAHDVVKGLIEHRQTRENAILRALNQRTMDIPTLVRTIYIDLPEHLVNAAALSVFAHLEDLTTRSLVCATPNLRLTSTYSIKR